MIKTVYPVLIGGAYKMKNMECLKCGHEFDDGSGNG